VRNKPVKLEYLILLFLFQPQGAFSKPNRTAFENVLHFLIKAYDPQLCRSVITSWPIIERKTQERIFRREVVVAVTKIASEEVDFGLPAFSQSFLSSPGGERLEIFFWKFSALSLRAVLQRHGEKFILNPPHGLNPRTCLVIAESRARVEKAALVKSLHSCVSFLKLCAEDAMFLSDALRANILKVKDSRKTLSELQVDESPVEDVLDSALYVELQRRVQKLLRSLQIIRNQEKTITKCAEVARSAMDDQPSVSVVDSKEPLDVAALLNGASVAVETISRRFGRPIDPNVYPTLLELHQQLLTVSQMMDENFKSLVVLGSTTFAQAGAFGGTRDSHGEVSTPERFRHARQLLEDVSHATPPLEFRSQTVFKSTWHTISADTISKSRNNFYRVELTLEVIRYLQQRFHPGNSPSKIEMKALGLSKNNLLFIYRSCMRL